MKKKIFRWVTWANLPRELCHHLIGEHHKVSHRMICGCVVMGVGVMVAHCAAGQPHFLAVLIDGVGYGIHALGATPFIEWLIAEEA